MASGTGTKQCETRRVVQDTPLTPALASWFGQSLFDPLHNGPHLLTIPHTPSDASRLYTPEMYNSRTRSDTMYRPMMFSAAHSALFEQAERQAREQAQPKLLWRRGFHSDGGLRGWGYYLEPAPSEGLGTADDDRETGEGSTGGEDVEDGSHEGDWEDTQGARLGHPGHLSRSLSQDTQSAYPASRSRLMLSHGALLRSVSSLLSHPQPPPPQAVD